MHTHQNVDVGVLDKALAALGRVSTIEDVEALPPAMTLKERILTIDQALRVISDLYVHLPMKRPRYAIDPVAALRLLRRESESLTDLIFQHRLIGVLDMLRDVHLAYTPPAPYVSMVAFLPFLMERAGACLDREARFLVTRLVADLGHDTFRPGVEVISWDGTPIDRAVALTAEIEGGNNRYSREALAVKYMTVRWLGANRLPDARWVAVGYRGRDGKAYEIRLPWRVLHLDKDQGFMFGSQVVWMLEDAANKAERANRATAASSTSKGLSLRSQVEARTRRRLFKTGVTAATDAHHAEGDGSRNANLRQMRSAVAGGKKGVGLLDIGRDLSSISPIISRRTHYSSGWADLWLYPHPVVRAQRLAGVRDRIQAVAGTDAPGRACARRPLQPRRGHSVCGGHSPVYEPPPSSAAGIPVSRH